MRTAKAENKGQADVKATLAVLRRQKWPQQYEAIQTLTTSADASADIILLHLLDSRTARVREAALNALGERSAALGRVAARVLLDDPDACARYAAAELLGRIGFKQDIRRLRHALSDKSWVMRATVADSLGRIGGTSVHPQLKTAMLNDPHSVVRRDAAFALSYAGRGDVVPDLERALTAEKGEQAQADMSAALYALGRAEYLTPLLAHLHSEASSVRYATINSLREITRPDDKEQVVQAIRDMLAREENPGLLTDGATIAEELRPPDNRRKQDAPHIDNNAQA